jgi:large subunit ribosomal protein L29
MAKAVTLRTLSDDQLLDELDSAKKELFNLRFAFATGQLDNSAQVAATKRDIARIHTVLREREIAAADLQAGASQGSAADLVGASQDSAAGLVGASQGSAAGSAAPTGDQS